MKALSKPQRVNVREKHHVTEGWTTHAEVSGVQIYETLVALVS